MIWDKPVRTFGHQWEEAEVLELTGGSVVYELVLPFEQTHPGKLAKLARQLGPYAEVDVNSMQRLPLSGDWLIRVRAPADPSWCL